VPVLVSIWVEKFKALAFFAHFLLRPAFLNFPLLFVVAATDELLHVQGREDHADPAVRAESTELPQVLQVTPTQKNLYLSGFIHLVVAFAECCRRLYLQNSFRRHSIAFLRLHCDH
jgi:ubiquinone biosynthesis protein UbiJ